MSEIFETNFAGISGYETDVTQEPITTTVLSYLSPSTGAAFYFKPASSDSVVEAPTSGELSVVPAVDDITIKLSNLTSVPQRVGKFYLTPPSSYYIPVIPSGNYTFTFFTKPKPVTQTYYVDIYGSDISEPYVDQLLGRTNDVVIPEAPSGDPLITFTTISLPAVYNKYYTFYVDIYAYGSGDFEMIVGNAVYNYQASLVNTTFPNTIAQSLS